MIRRREFIAALGGAATWPLPGCLVVGRDGADNQRNHARGIVQGPSPAIGRNLDIGAAVIRFGGSDP